MGIFDSSIEIELQKIRLVGVNRANSTLSQNLFLILVALKMVFKKLPTQGNRHLARLKEIEGFGNTVLKTIVLILVSLEHSHGCCRVTS